MCRFEKRVLGVLAFVFAIGLACGTVISAEGGKININTASEEELASLPGIGPAKAKATIAYREENGDFAKIEDIINVEGIGQKVFDQIKDSITVETEEPAAEGAETGAESAESAE